MKRVSRMLLVLCVMAVGVLLAEAAPAAAANKAAGTVDGTVSISPGVSLTPTNNSFTFAPINLTGVFVVGNKNYAGAITTSIVTGSSQGETTVKGAGTVNPFTIRSTPTNVLSGSCWGKFSRAGSIVTVKLTCSGTLKGTSGPLKITVAAQFSPTKGNGATTKATKASFVGVYEG